MRTATLILAALLLGTSLAPGEEAKAKAADASNKQVSLVVKGEDSPFVLGQNDSIATVENFRPPVEITLVAKTDSTNIRLGYAANQVIFNWELNPKQLRVDGGPADKKHKNGAGQIPIDEYVTIQWRVTPKKQTLLVDGQLRFEHEGDYSKIDKPVRVFTHKAYITVKSLEVKPLPPGTE